MSTRQQTKNTGAQQPQASNLKSLFRTLFITAVCIYIAIPLILLVFPKIVEQVVFLNLLCLPLSYERLNEPLARYNLSHCGHFNLKSGNNVYGAWHLVPTAHENLYAEFDFVTEKRVKDNLLSAKNVILYLHGNGLHRGIRHRINMYKRLQNEMPDHHIITFDYRGFGDTEGWPSEKILTEDAMILFNWVKDHVSTKTKITMWGHSLGSSISTIATAKMIDLCKENQQTCRKPDYLILEGTFTNLRIAASESPLAVLLFPRQLFTYVLDNVLERLDLHLNTELHFKKIDIPVLILHADDDDIISVHHGRDMFAMCEKLDHQNPITFVRLLSHHRCSHNHVSKSGIFIKMLQKFYNDKSENLCKEYHV